MNLDEELKALPLMDRILANCQMMTGAEYIKVAQIGTRRAELELKAAETSAAAVKNMTRPSMMLHAIIGREGKKYTASAVGLTVEGDTPEMAFDNFDHAWTYGENDAK